MFCSLFICVRFGSAVKTLQMRWLHSLLVSGVLNAILTCSESLEEDLSGDGGVLKRCLRTGTGSALPQGESGSIVRATVRGPIAVSPSGEVLDDPGITEIILGQGQISRGLDMAIGSMREKEEALIRLSASYAPKNRISEDATFKLEVLKFDLLDASSLHRGPTGLRLFQRTLSVAAMEEVVIGSTQAPGGIGQLQMELKTDGKGCYRMLMIGLGHA
eukprot:s1396_g4.t1